MPTLTDAIPEHGFADDDAALEAFLDWVLETGIEPYAAQEEAFLELFSGNHVVLKTPTGSGKSLVALALHFRDFAFGRRSIYTAPIKALVSEKFLALCESFGAEHVGLMTGDGAVNRDAPILCCTAEILSKLALRHGEDTPFTGVVMDEFHYYGDRDRGMAWQIPLLTMPHAQFLLMSATLGDTRPIEADLLKRTGTQAVAVTSAQRPVPLDFEYSEIPLESKLQNLAWAGKAPVYAVHFTQRAATERAQALMSSKFSDQDEKKALRDAVKSVRFDSPFGPTLKRYLEHGVGLHHAGLLPRYRLLVEQLSQRGLFKVICGTDTLGVGINVPIRTVFFTQLCKFDGEQTVILSRRHFKQIAGRAGRRGFDSQGYVVAQAPDWVIENAQLSDAIAAGRKKRNKVRRKSAPTRGYKHWDQATFEKLIQLPPEDLTPRFRVDHGLVLSLLQKAAEELGSEPLDELHQLIDQSHASQRQRVKLHAAADQRMAELIDSEVVTDLGPGVVPRYELAPGLQHDFSLHHTLSLFLVQALPAYDPASPTYVLDVVGLVESILENPRPVLFALVHREKGFVLNELKAQGVEYDERMEALEEVTWPKPGAEKIYALFNGFREHRPWLTEDPIRPKAVVRELIEHQVSFASFVKDLRLERVEGVLLRYISQVYRTLRQNVPEDRWTPGLEDALATLRALLARVDDSLVRTWEGLLESDEPAAAGPVKVDISTDLKRFRARIRAELYAVVKALSVGDLAEAAACQPTHTQAWGADDFERNLEPYLLEHDAVIFDARLKQGWMTRIERVEAHLWRVSQTLVTEVELGEYEEYAQDAGEADSAWSIEGMVDLRGDRNPSGTIVRIVGIEG